MVKIQKILFMAVELSKVYKKRWSVEIFFKLLKRNL